MKVQLIKQIEWDRTWYVTVIDGTADKYFIDEKDAQKRYNEILGKAKQPTVREIMKEEEI